MASTTTPFVRPRSGRTYYAVLSDHFSDLPCLPGSRYSVLVDPPDSHEWGRVFTTRAFAQKFLDSLPTRYRGPIPTRRARPIALNGDPCAVGSWSFADGAHAGE